jgi:hypothetical protein
MNRRTIICFGIFLLVLIHLNNSWFWDDLGRDEYGYPIRHNCDAGYICEYGCSYEVRLGRVRYDKTIIPGADAKTFREYPRGRPWNSIAAAPLQGYDSNRSDE